MGDFIIFLEQHYSGILILLLLCFAIMIIISWIANVFSIGKYRSSRGPKSGFIYVFAELMVKIITDFRHFLALVLVLIFAIALGYAFYISNNNIENLSKALQAVVSTLGGLVGSIVGYYFGESAARAKSGDSNAKLTSQSSAPVQGQSGDDIEEVKPPEGIE